MGRQALGFTETLAYVFVMMETGSYRSTEKKETFLLDYANSHTCCHEEFVWELIYKTGTRCHYTALKQKKKINML